MTRLLSLRHGEKLTIAVASLVFVLLAADVMVGGLVVHFDERIRDAIQPRPPATPLWMAFPGGLGELWVAAPLIVIGGVVVAQLTWTLWPIVLAVGSFAVVELVVLVLKVVVGREGPGAQAERIGYPGYFPSGHTATSAVCSGVLVFLLVGGKHAAERIDRATTIALAVGLTFGAVAALRSVLGDFHWASDGVGGLLVGLVVLVLAFAATRNHLASKPRELDSPTSP